MDDNKGFSWGWIIFIILILWFFVGGNLGGDRGKGNGNGDCGGKSNCDIEIQALKTAYETNFNIVNSNHQVQDVLGTKIDFYGYENCKDQLAQARDKITFLETNANTDAKFNTLSRQMEVCCCDLNAKIAEFACMTPQRPQFYGSGTYGNPCGTC